MIALWPECIQRRHWIWHHFLEELPCGDGVIPIVVEAPDQLLLDPLADLLGEYSLDSHCMHSISYSQP